LKRKGPRTEPCGTPDIIIIMIIIIITTTATTIKKRASIEELQTYRIL
jgi:hypothetical protein